MIRRRLALRWLAGGANLRLVVGTLVALALFGYVVDIASHGDLLGGIGTVVGQVGWLALVLAVPFFALRALTWHLLLRQVGVVAPWRQAVAAFCAGELTKSLPLGVYLETYVLARIERLNERQVVGAAVATTGMDVMIGAITFVTAMLTGLPERGWFRLLLISIAGAWIVLYAGIWLAVRWWRPQDRPLTSRLALGVGRIVTEVGRGAARLVRPAVVWPLLTTAATLTISVVVMWLVLSALGLGGIGLGGAMSAVVIISLVNVLLPIPVELGVTEITGVGVLGIFGVDARDAAIAMLGYRVVTSGALTIVVLGVMATLRSAYRRAPELPAEAG